MIVAAILFYIWSLFFVFIKQGKKPTIVIGTIGSENRDSYRLRFTGFSADNQKHLALSMFKRNNDKEKYDEAFKRAELIALKTFFLSIVWFKHVKKSVFYTANPLFLNPIIRLLLLFFAIRVLDFRVTRTKAINHIQGANDMLMSKIALDYFVAHPDLYQNIPEGLMRARAVALHELKRYPDSCFLPE